MQRQDWITRTENANVLIQSCQVCRDNSGGQSAPAAGATRLPDAELEPVIEVEPVYPPTAQTQGLDGYVELSFSVTPFGIVQGAQVTASEPEGVFNDAAIAAVNRWRYAQDSERAPQTVTTRFDFSVSDYIWQLPDNQGTAGTTMQDIPVGRWNQCVREDAVYNFGEMIEVRLMNACQQPLIVFGCAEGTGRYLGRWVCTDSERQENVFVSPNDQRIGDLVFIDTPTGSRPYRYTDSFFMARTPNTEYWWMACHEMDNDCRADARLWERSLDRQLARIDPQTRTMRSVARSY